MQERRKPETAVEHMRVEEWRKTHRDFKSQINGQRYVLRAIAADTALVPAVINKDAKQ